MHENIGNTDKYIRVLLGTSLAIAVLGGFLQGVLATVVGVVAAALLFTAWVNFCPIYAMLNYSTRPHKRKT